MSAQTERPKEDESSLGWNEVTPATVAHRGSYKVKLEAALRAVESLTEQISGLRQELVETRLLLQKCHISSVETVIRLRAALGGTGLETSLPQLEINKPHMFTCPPRVHAEGLIQILTIFCRAFEILKRRGTLHDSDLKALNASIVDSMSFRPSSIPSPILRSYSMLTKALDDLKAEDTPTVKPAIS